MDVEKTKKPLKIVVVRDGHEGHITDVFSTEKVEVLEITTWFTGPMNPALQCVPDVCGTVVASVDDLREVVFDEVSKLGLSELMSPGQSEIVSQFLS